MKDKFKIIISGKAREMLAEHLVFLARVNSGAASRLKENFLKSFKRLEDSPGAFPFFNENYIPVNTYHKLIVEHRYLVLFQIKNRTVYIDYIIDGRQDYEWLI